MKIIIYILAILLSPFVINAQINDSTLMVGMIIENTSLYDSPNFLKSKTILDINDGICFYVVGYKKDPIGTPFKGWYQIVLSDKVGFIAAERTKIPEKYRQYLISKSNSSEAVRLDYAQNVYKLSSVKKRNKIADAFDELLKELKKTVIPLTHEVDLSHLDYNPTSLAKTTQATSNSTTSISTCDDNKLRNYAKREYPSDKQMEDYVYKNQLIACNYMNSVSDFEIKKFSQTEYPEDYTMQKYTYDNQLLAKMYMNSVTDSELKGIALREYPNDYSMQKYTYDNQFTSKAYMKSAKNLNAKSKAEKEYPGDYVMQKYTYDKIAF